MGLVQATVTPVDDAVNVNEVVLHGRMAAPAQRRVLPSGDLLLSFRVIVDRSIPDGQAKRRVDTIDCLAWTARTQRSVGSWNAGDLVSIEGALRRRFRRYNGGALSRVEVEVRRARRLRQASS